MLSNHTLPPKMPSKSLKMDDCDSLLPNCQDEISFMRLPEVKSVTGLSKSSIYDLIQANSFPAPVPLGERTVAWVRSEVQEWAAERISKSRSEPRHTDNRRTPRNTLEGTGPPQRDMLRVPLSVCPQPVVPPDSRPTTASLLYAASGTSHDCMPRKPCSVSYEQVASLHAHRQSRSH